MTGKLSKVVIVGGGPAGMMAAWHLAGNHEVHLYEKEARLGRKFLVAGKGGLNITRHLDVVALKASYEPSGFMDRALSAFDSESLRNWMLQLGFSTFVGTSGKVFPAKDITALQILNKLIDSLKERGVIIHNRHRLVRFDEFMNFTFEQEETNPDVIDHLMAGRKGSFQTVTADYAVLALGGASWPQTGSDGKWVEVMKQNEVSTLPFRPSNCGVNIGWPGVVRESHAGKPLKNIKTAIGTLAARGAESVDQTTREWSAASGNMTATGEALITEYGLEGTAIYPLVPEIRRQLLLGVIPQLTIDFKPQNTSEQLLEKLKESPSGHPSGAGKEGKSAMYRTKLSLNSAQLAVIKAFTYKEVFADPVRFCRAVKQVVIPVHSLRPVEEAISVVGGVDLNELNSNYSLKKFPRIFIIGEMSDWDAPTGGFLLQGCFSMGAYVASAMDEIF
ncbi:MAG: TIGR03862 family flavoprotein [Lentimicrobiaceae bacterium]